MPKCGRCGEEAKGFATINDVRYCHTDEVYHDCYQQARWDRGIARDLSLIHI